MERYICERRCDEGLRSFKVGFVEQFVQSMQEEIKE
nr:MAG TPA: hypothetical protein [Caudoviricetes sp.]